MLEAAAVQDLRLLLEQAVQVVEVMVILVVEAILGHQELLIQEVVVAVVGMVRLAVQES